MKFFMLTAVLLFTCLQPYAQMPQVYLKPKQSKALGALSKTATLVVIIENEKNADDAALISAVKEYWKIGAIKYMSLLEFTEKFKSGTLDRANLYLYNNYTRKYVPATGAVVTFNPSKYQNMPALRQGYYLTHSPVELTNALKYEKAPPYLFFSANNLADKRGKPIQGFYSLMIKNFNHDVVYCQDESNFKKSKKMKRKKGIYFFAADSIATKTLLLVKEQMPQTLKSKDEGKKKNQASEKQDLVTDDYTNSKKPVVVFPEDIDYAVKKNDRDILLYSGGRLYSAMDGSVYATIDGKTGGSGGAILTFLGLAACVAGVVLVLL